MFVTLEGQSQILLANAAGVTSHDFGTGKVLWKFSWANSEGINVAQPVALPAFNQVLVATGYGKGAAVIRLAAANNEEGRLAGIGPWSVETIWTNSRVMRTKFTTPVPYRDFVYGLDDGILECIDPKSGKAKWKDGRYGHGQILLAGDRLIVQAENGTVVLVEPSPEKLIERGRVAALSSRTWNNPALAGRMLLVRNDREAACYELPDGN
jgi:outer membrane protein assembly factor BamB